MSLLNLTLRAVGRLLADHWISRETGADMVRSAATTNGGRHE